MRKKMLCLHLIELFIFLPGFGHFFFAFNFEIPALLNLINLWSHLVVGSSVQDNDVPFWCHYIFVGCKMIELHSFLNLMLDLS